MGVLGKLAIAAVALGASGAGAGWMLSAPVRLDAATLAAAAPGDAERGRRIFFAGGCSSCHARPGAEGDDRFALAGGRELKTPFGTFVVPNISQHPQDGIGGWSAADFANAMMRGVSPSGEHFYPAFPYASYARMNPADVGDLYAFLKTTPSIEGRTADHALDFPFNVRRGIGLWKRLHLDASPVVALAADAPEPVKLGRYLVEGPGHCGECHTRRGFDGGTDRALWLAGAPAAEGGGTVPNITPGAALATWSEDDIVAYLETGFTPEFDVVGGAMADVQKNMAELTPEDRAAIAAYLKAVPPHGGGG
ncbi:MAG: cytochrome c [Rhizobiaceae bacterium]